MKFKQEVATIIDKVMTIEDYVDEIADATNLAQLLMGLDGLENAAEAILVTIRAARYLHTVTRAANDEETDEEGRN